MSRRLLHLDAFSGAAGNMFLGAMLDLGLPRARLLEGLAPLGLDFKLRGPQGAALGALAARYVDVVVPEAKRAPRGKPRASAARRPRVAKPRATSRPRPRRIRTRPRARRSEPRSLRARARARATPTAAATPRSAA